MKYKGLLVFLIICLIVVSCALITFAIMSKDTRMESDSVINNTTNTENAINETKNVANTLGDDIKNNTNSLENNTTLQENNETNEQNQNEKKEVSNSEEERKETGKSKKEKQDIALNLTKEEWGEDDTVYYTIDRQTDNIYYISVRSKSTTETLAEYEVEIVNKTVQIR